jgi:hypothetical protein
VDRDKPEKIKKKKEQKTHKDFLKRKHIIRALVNELKENSGRQTI